MTIPYRVKDWTKHFENNRTRELKRMDWVPIPNRMDDLGYAELVDHPNGAAHLGAWLAILEIASRCPERGTLRRSDGTVLGAAELAKISRLAREVFSEVLPRLVAIGWLECPQVPLNQSVAKIPQEGAEIPQEGAARARSLPFHSLPFSPGGAGGKSAVSERFSEWLKPWPRVGDPDGACRAWLSYVNSPEDEAGAFAARDRYLASAEVARGVQQEPAKFLEAQSRGRWGGRWPAVTEDRTRKLSVTERAIARMKREEEVKNGKSNGTGSGIVRELPTMR